MKTAPTHEEPSVAATAHASHADHHHETHAAHHHRETEVVFRIARQDKPGASRYWQEFRVPYTPGMNVISALQWIAANPVPTGSSEPVAPVAWDCNCLEEVCGACTMLINGKVRQSCSALVDNLDRMDGGWIELEPMQKFPVMRDLVVDRSRLFDGLKKVKAWIPVDGYYLGATGDRQSPEQQEEAYPLSTCMSCGCCLDACPQYAKIEVERGPGETDAEYAARKTAAHNEGFMGAAVISQAVLFNSHPTGKLTKGPRIEAMMEEGGITDCGNSQNCVKVCPKNIPLTRSIAKAGRDTSIHSIRKWLSI